MPTEKSAGQFDPLICQPDDARTQPTTNHKQGRRFAKNIHNTSTA